ncbi:MAG: hypothetical protein GX335_10355, partial [Firmicutes bacterium]|nr:hypothetical protein [Bacillota bacterium]
PQCPPKIVGSRAYSNEAKEPEGRSKKVLSYANTLAAGLFTTVEDLAKQLRNLKSAQAGGTEFADLIRRPYRFKNDWAREIGHCGAVFRSRRGRFDPEVWT